MILLGRWEDFEDKNVNADSTIFFLVGVLIPAYSLANYQGYVYIYIYTHTLSN